MVINEWLLAGIVIDSANATIVGNFIGSDVKGEMVFANLKGIYSLSDGNIIGTPV